MQEFNFNERKKQNAEFITPERLRLFLKDEIGEVKEKTIFDPAGGSGQLLFNIEAKRKIVNEINKDCEEYCKINNIDEFYNNDYILFDDSDLNYDIAISNYPYSLKATEEQNKYLSKKYNLKKWTGTLDYEFIIKSFQHSNDGLGYYLCFNGIAYREGEKRHRQYLIDNNFIEKIYLLENTGFEDTNIAILYLKLNKNKVDDKITLQIQDNYEIKQTKIIINQDLIDKDYNFSITNFIKQEQEEIDYTAELKQINEQLIETNINNIKKCLETFYTIDIFEGNKGSQSLYKRYVDKLLLTIEEDVKNRGKNVKE